MANDAAGLLGKLETKLDDTSNAVWPDAELADLIAWAVSGLYPRYARTLNPSAGGTDITLNSGTIFYAVPTGCLEVTSVDWLNDDGEELGTLQGQTWQMVGDKYGATLKIRVAPKIAEQEGKIRVHGHGRYDVTTNLIPDDLVPLVLAIAAAEAYRRLAGERARYEQYATRRPNQVVSMNEVLNYLANAEAEALRQRALNPATRRRPVPGRLG